MRRAGAVRQQGDLAASSRATSGTPEPRGPCVSLPCVPVGSTHGLPPRCPSGMARGVPSSSVPRRGVVGDGGSWPGYLFASVPVPPPHAALPQVRAEQDRSHLSGGAPGPGAPVAWGPLQDGCLSPVLVHRGGWWGRFLRNRSPGATHPGCTSGAQLLPPPPTLGPSTWGCGCLWPPPAPLLPSCRHPALIPGGPGRARGLSALQMVPRS